MGYFVFDGVDSRSLGLVTGNRKTTLLPAIRENTIEVPGRPGVYDFGFEFGAREITVPFSFVAGSREQLSSTLRTLAAWLGQNQPKVLAFDDEPDKFYYARLAGPVDIERFAEYGEGEITFFCADPFAYSTAEKTYTFSNSVTVENNGSADVFPTLDISVTTSIPYLIIATPTEFLMLGDEDNAEATKIDPYELKFWDEFVDLTKWSTATYVDGGTVTGSFQVQSGDWYIYPSDYGTGTTWHGPAIKAALPELLTDFEVVMIAQFNNTVANNAVGRLEIYLLDQNSAIFGKIAIKDVDGSSPTISLEARAGALGSGKFFVVDPPAAKKALNNMAGYIKIGRVGKRWYAFWGKIEPYFSGNVTTHYGWVTWDDNASKYTNKLAQIQVHAGAYSTYPPCGIRIDDIKVYKRNTKTTGQVAYVAKAGDILTVDCYKAEVRKNKQIDWSIINPISRFIRLPVGTTPISVYPKNSANITLKFRERWL